MKIEKCVNRKMCNSSSDIKELCDNTKKLLEDIKKICDNPSEVSYKPIKLLFEIEKSLLKILYEYKK